MEAGSRILRLTTGTEITRDEFNEIINYNRVKDKQMKKTKEFNVTLIESPHDGGYQLDEYIQVEGQGVTLRGKLVIEVEEQKLEISESQFQTISDYFSNSADKHVVKIVKEKLGFK